MKSELDKYSKIKLVIVAPLPPPYGGICFLTKALMDNGLGIPFKTIFLNVAKNTVREDIGRITLADFKNAIINYFKFCKILIINKPNAVYLVTTADTAIYRDGIFVLTAKILGCRILLHLHGIRESSLIRFSKMHKWYIQQIISRVDHIVVPTEIDFKGLTNFYYKNIPKSIIYNTVSIPSFYRGFRFNRIHSNYVMLVGIGRLSKAKGCWDLLHALFMVIQKEPNVRLTWIGLGAYPNDDFFARKLCESLNISKYVRFAGKVHDTEKFSILSESDIFVLPSHSEGFPLAAIEGMAMGLPVVTTSVGGIPELIKNDKTGYIVKPRDEFALADKILHLVRNPGKRSRLGKSGASLFWKHLEPGIAVNRLNSIIGSWNHT